jgi:hypothetical protein
MLGMLGPIIAGWPDMTSTYFKCIDNTGGWTPDLKAMCPGASGVPCIAGALQPVKLPMKTRFGIGGKRWEAEVCLWQVWHPVGLYVITGHIL